MTVRKKIARYRLFINKNDGGSVDIVAAERDENLPSDLHILSAPVRGTQLRFTRSDSAIMAVNPPDSGKDMTQIVVKDAKTIRTISVCDLESGFSNPDILQKLMKMNGGVETIADLLGICHNAIMRFIGAIYPDAATRIENGDIIVDAATSLPARSPASRPSPAMPARSRRERHLHVWI